MIIFVSYLSPIYRLSLAVYLSTVLLLLAINRTLIITLYIWSRANNGISVCEARLNIAEERDVNRYISQRSSLLFLSHRARIIYDARRYRSSASTESPLASLSRPAPILITSDTGATPINLHFHSWSRGNVPCHGAGPAMIVVDQAGSHLAPLQETF